MMPPAARGLLELSFDLGAMDSEAAEAACFECGAGSVTFVDAHDDHPGEARAIADVHEEENDERGLDDGNRQGHNRVRPVKDMV